MHADIEIAWAAGFFDVAWTFGMQEREYSPSAES